MLLDSLLCIAAAASHSWRSIAPCW
uniref:Uncharacterized protein n=1 Tax=Anguilla anguilla TaxID=7936 RepID=A0A0E9QMU2_ANGAN